METANPYDALGRMAAEFAALTGSVLAAGDPERLVLQAVAAEIGRLYSVLDIARGQDLLDAASGDHLEGLVALVGVERRAETPSVASVRVFRDQDVVAPDGRQRSIVVPEGTRFEAAGVTFLADRTQTITPYVEAVDVAVTSAEVGAGPNGAALFLEAELLDEVEGVLSALLVDAVSGGSTPETDASLRLRAELALARLSAAGPADRYALLALEAHPEVGDARVSTPEPGQVRVVVAGHDGDYPSEAALASVEAVVTSDAVRQVGHAVTVSAPAYVVDELEVSYTVDPVALNRLGAVADGVAEAAARYLAWQQGGLGRDVTPSRLVAEVQSVTGVASVTVRSPTAQAVDDDALVSLQVVGLRYQGATA